MGPTGIGGLYVRDGIEIRHTRAGGTGVRSAQRAHLDEYPYRLEYGTPNLLGIAGLHAGVEWLLGARRHAVHGHEMGLIRRAARRPARPRRRDAVLPGRPRGPHRRAGVQRRGLRGGGRRARCSTSTTTSRAARACTARRWCTSSSAPPVCTAPCASASGRSTRRARRARDRGRSGRSRRFASPWRPPPPRAEGPGRRPASPEVAFPAGSGSPDSEAVYLLSFPAHLAPQPGGRRRDDANSRHHRRPRHLLRRLSPPHRRRRCRRPDARGGTPADLRRLDRQRTALRSDRASAARETIGPFVGNTHSESSVTGALMTEAYHEAHAHPQPARQRRSRRCRHHGRIGDDRGGQQADPHARARVPEQLEHYMQCRPRSVPSSS